MSSGSLHSSVGLDQVFPWVGMEDRSTPLRAVRWRPHRRDLCKPGQASGSGWPARRNGSYMGLFRQNSKIQRVQTWQDSHAQWRWRSISCWRSKVAWMAGILVVRAWGLLSGGPPQCYARLHAHTTGSLPGHGRRKLQVANNVPLPNLSESTKFTRNYV